MNDNISVEDTVRKEDDTGHSGRPANRGPDSEAGAGTVARAFGAVTGFLEKFSLLVVLIVIAVFFSFYGPTSGTFPTQQNFEVTVANQAVLAIVSLGLLIPLIADKFDLSVGAAAGLSAVFTASMMSGGTPVVIAILVGIALAVVVGLVNAYLVARLELDSVVATLGTATLASGVVIHKTGGQSIVANIPDSVRDFGTGKLWILPNSLVLLLVFAFGAWVILEHTSAGRQIYALGSNPKAALLVGLRTRGILAGTFVLAGLLSGVGGALLVARSGGADPFAGGTLLLPAFAAVFLSATTVKPGTYNVGGLLVAVFFLATLNSGLNLAGAPPYVSDYVNGGALIVGVALATILHRRQLGK